MDELKAKLKKELAELYSEGVQLLMDEIEREQEQYAGEEKSTTKKGRAEDKKTNLHIDYQSWYSKALPVVRQLLPERYSEFCEQYKLEKRKNITFTTYTIADYMIGLRVTKGYYKEEVVNPLSAFYSKFQLQLTILNSAIERIDSLLADIEGVIQSQLFDNELHAAEDLHKKKHLRASGALAGVTLETHLSKVSANHGAIFRKKSPTISDYNEELKKQGVIDVPTWRLIQRLGDIRNLCVHAKERDPSYDEIGDLIEGVKKITSTVF